MKLRKHWGQQQISHWLLGSVSLGLLWGCSTAGTPQISLEDSEDPAEISATTTEASTTELTLVYQGEPLFEIVDQYDTQILGVDPADVYFPVVDQGRLGGQETQFPLALVLQGGLVDKQFYSNYAQVLAQYGFVVVVPNRFRSFPVFNLEGFLPNTELIRDTLTHMVAENERPEAPVNGVIETETMVLLGHSLGGGVALSALAGECQIFICQGELDLPSEVQGGAFYGANRTNLRGEVDPTPNQGFPIAILAGEVDGVSTLDETVETFEEIENPPKLLVVIDGANHYSVTDVNNPAGAIPDASESTLDQAIANETIARWSGLFLRAEILGDRRASRYIYGRGDRLDRNVEVTAERL